jgi:hypothetical protein
MIPLSARLPATSELQLPSHAKAPLTKHGKPASYPILVMFFNQPYHISRYVAQAQICSTDGVLEVARSLKHPQKPRPSWPSSLVVVLPPSCSARRVESSSPLCPIRTLPGLGSLVHHRPVIQVLAYGPMEWRGPYGY